MSERNERPANALLGGHTYTSAADRWADQKRLVVMVATTYRAVKDLPSVIAFNPDEESRSRASKWSPETAHYVADVENTIRRVIDSKPEAELLWAAWNGLLSDDNNKPGKDEQKLVRLLAGPFFTKRLHPGLYFRTDRYAHRRPR